MEKTEIKIPHKTPYTVYIGKGILSKLNNLLNEKKLYRNIFTIIDKQVYKYHRSKIDSVLNQEDDNVKVLLLKSSENLKTTDSLHKIYSSLQKYNFGRDTLILAVGGGIVGDIAGFAAATYNRGVQYIQIPTTLLAAVDSSVGGKTGLNFGRIKNSIGSFYQPQMVITDTEFFNTLPDKEILSGVGEIVKYAFISDTRLCSYIFRNINSLYELNNRVTDKIISSTVRFKRDVIIADEKEKSIRKILNLGHTFAHAIEVEQNYKIKHGAAVIVGIACSLFLSCRLGILPENKMLKHIEALKKLAGKVRIKSFNNEKIINIMRLDKKNKDNKIKFVLLQEIGKILIDVEADLKSVDYSLNEGLKLFSK